MIIYASAHRRCCVQAQARGVQGAAAPPGKLMIFPKLCADPVTFGRGRLYAVSPFHGETPQSHLAENKQQQQQQYHGVAHGSCAIHRGQGISIKPFGVTPLSLIFQLSRALYKR